MYLIDWAGLWGITEIPLSERVTPTVSPVVNERIAAYSRSKRTRSVSSSSVLRLVYSRRLTVATEVTMPIVASVKRHSRNVNP